MNIDLKIEILIFDGLQETRTQNCVKSKNSYILLIDIHNLELWLANFVNFVLRHPVGDNRFETDFSIDYYVFEDITALLIFYK